MLHGRHGCLLDNLLKAVSGTLRWQGNSGARALAIFLDGVGLQTVGPGVKSRFYFTNVTHVSQQRAWIGMRTLASISMVLG